MFFVDKPSVYTKCHFVSWNLVDLHWNSHCFWTNEPNRNEPMF